MSTERLKEISRELYLLKHISALLSWDQETLMPPAAIEERSEQLALLQGQIHDRMTAPETSDLLAACADNAELSALDSAYLRRFRMEQQREIKLPRDLVIQLTKTASASIAAWTKAREQDDFGLFSPYLNQIVALVREKAAALGFEGHPYDALVDEYEPGMTVETLERVLSSPLAALSDFVQKVLDAGPVDDSFLYRHYAPEKQKEFSLKILKDIGFPFERGRLDESAHPFTTTLGCDDVRITTRYLPDFFNSALFGTIHEAGHAFYELGFGAEIRGNILADGTSLGIHESQSRTWENLIGRSRAFWERYYPELQSLFPENLKNVSMEVFYRGINRVSRGFIRVEADEVTYNLHVALRYELEKALITRDLEVDELPGEWRSRFQKLFGLVPPTDREGVLQDIHWSMGAFGYFPTYALGNLYAAQFYLAMEQDLGSIPDRVRSGDFEAVRSWLAAKIHYHGAAKLPAELARDICGQALSPEPFFNAIKSKYKGLYSL